MRRPSESIAIWLCLNIFIYVAILYFGLASYAEISDASHHWTWQGLVAPVMVAVWPAALLGFILPSFIGTIAARKVRPAPSWRRRALLLMIFVACELPLLAVMTVSGGLFTSFAGWIFIGFVIFVQGLYSQLMMAHRT